MSKEYLKGLSDLEKKNSLLEKEIKEKCKEYPAQNYPPSLLNKIKKHDLNAITIRVQRILESSEQNDYSELHTPKDILNALEANDTQDINCIKLTSSEIDETFKNWGKVRDFIPCKLLEKVEPLTHK